MLCMEFLIYSPKTEKSPNLVIGHAEQLYATHHHGPSGDGSVDQPSMRTLPGGSIPPRVNPCAHCNW